MSSAPLVARLAVQTRFNAADAVSVGRFHPHHLRVQVGNVATGREYLLVSEIEGYAPSSSSGFT